MRWLYFGYLAAIKTQNGAAMSIGRISTFMDIYIQRELDKGILTETEGQELIDHLTMKFRMVKFAPVSYTHLHHTHPKPSLSNKGAFWQITSCLDTGR